MARNQFRGGRPLGRGAKLRKTWCRNVSVPGGLVLTGVQAEISACILSEDSALDGTILRSRGQYLLEAVPNGAFDRDIVGLGICVVSETSRAVGGASLPGPIADIGSDIWLWHSLIPLSGAELTSSVDNHDSIGAIVRGEIDSKAMRKIMTDQAVVLIGELSTANFASVTVSAGMAWLIGS